MEENKEQQNKDYALLDKVNSLKGKSRCKKCNQYFKKNALHRHVQFCDGTAHKKQDVKRAGKEHVCPYCGMIFIGRAINGHRLSCLQNPDRMKYVGNLRQWGGMSREEYLEKFGKEKTAEAPSGKLIVKCSDGTIYELKLEEGI